MSLTPTDAELVCRAKTGDSQALTLIYERYAAAIYRYIYYRVCDNELAEDLRAEVFLRMLEGIHRYEDRGWPLSAWLYRIAHDRTVDSLRRRRSRAQLSLECWNGVSEGPEQAVNVRLDCEEIRQVITRLTDDQRRVIQMRFMQEMSVQEVARELGRTEGVVKALQHRGLQTMARHLDQTPN